MKQKKSAGREQRGGMRIKYVPVGKIRTNDYNPNIMSEVVYAGLKKSISEDGLSPPILVRPPDKNGAYIIVDGAHRYKAAVELGYERIPCIVNERYSKEDYAVLATIKMGTLRGEQSPTEVGVIYQKLIAKKAFTVEEIADFTGQMASQIKYRVNLLSVSKPTPPEFLKPKEEFPFTFIFSTPEERLYVQYFFKTTKIAIDGALAISTLKDLEEKKKDESPVK